VSGSGFSKNTRVIIGNNDCKTVAISYYQLSCIVPSNVKAQNQIKRFLCMFYR
jgi:hypothetical protein